MRDTPIVELRDYRRAEDLLAACDLRTDELRTRRGLHLFGLDHVDGVAGLVGLERHGKVGLLRALAVLPAHRNRGLGQRLVAHAEREAGAHDIDRLYLLTTTAAEFFARLGYAPTPRAEAPPAIAATAQFSSLCPASSTFMSKVLARAPSMR